MTDLTENLKNAIILPLCTKGDPGTESYAASAAAYRVAEYLYHHTDVEVDWVAINDEITVDTFIDTHNSDYENWMESVPKIQP